MCLGSVALALAPFTDTISYLEDGDWVVLTRTGAVIHDKHNAIVHREAVKHAASTSLVKPFTGRVVYCGWNYADGADPAWIVIIAHSSELSTWYAHMTPRCPAGAGSVVNKGQVIGREGNTGRSTGAHLHWMVQFNGSFVNPRLFT